jgi:hypothetical protein
MAAIIYAGKRSADRPGPELETRQAAVEEAWKIWQLTTEGESYHESRSAR